MAASLVADPRSIALKLCNAAGQGLAYHFGLGFMAPALGSLVEQTLSSVVDPPNRLSSAVQGLQALDVTIDVATGHLTPAVNDFAAAELDAVLQDKTLGISQAELVEIEEAIRQRLRSKIVNAGTARSMRRGIDRDFDSALRRARVTGWWRR